MSTWLASAADKRRNGIQTWPHIKLLGDSSESQESSLRVYSRVVWSGALSNWPGLKKKKKIANGICINSSLNIETSFSDWHERTLFTKWRSEDRWGANRVMNGQLRHRWLAEKNWIIWSNLLQSCCDFSTYSGYLYITSIFMNKLIPSPKMAWFTVRELFDAVGFKNDSDKCFVPA